MKLPMDIILSHFNTVHMITVTWILPSHLILILLSRLLHSVSLAKNVNIVIPFYLSRFCCPNNIWWRIKNIKLPVTQFFLPLPHFLSPSIFFRILSFAYGECSVQEVRQLSFKQNDWLYPRVMANIFSLPAALDTQLTKYHSKVFRLSYYTALLPFI
jgi:hypothetical protein